MSATAARTRSAIFAKILAYVVLLLASAFVLIPFLWMITSALKTNDQVFTFPPKWIPSPVMWSNFRTALTHLPFATYLKNTLTIVVFTIIGNTLSNAIVAFGFARLRAPGRICSSFWRSRR
jgi:multiple sugar transport system permease protein